MLNLDDKAERDAFINRFGTSRGMRVANALGIRGKGAKRIGTALSCYAWNAHTAYQCRFEGNVTTARQYEDIADRIYRDDLAELGFW